jgi:hypothetical protein
MYAVGPNDREFLFLRYDLAVAENTGSLVLVENWLEEIEARLKN